MFTIEIARSVEIHKRSHKQRKNKRRETNEFSAEGAHVRRPSHMEGCRCSALIKR